MATHPAQSQTVALTGLSNEAFLGRYAKPGCLGLSGGVTPIDRAISRSQRHLDAQETWSPWSHTFLFQGRRGDGRHWVIESDLQLHRRHIQLGVQENRGTKCYDEGLYTSHERAPSLRRGWEACDLPGLNPFGIQSMGYGPTVASSAAAWACGVSPWAVASSAASREA